MRYCYVDSSALAKVYILESGSWQMKDLLRSARMDPPSVRVLVSALSALEVISAVQRKIDTREITRAEGSQAVERILSDFAPDPPPDASPYQVIFPGPGIMQHGQELITVHRLRTYDAIHLATAIAARHSLPLESRFELVCCDENLCRAAEAEGIEVYDPAA